MRNKISGTKATKGDGPIFMPVRPSVSILQESYETGRAFFFLPPNHYKSVKAYQGPIRAKGAQ